MVVDVRFRGVCAARRSETSAPIGRTFREVLWMGMVRFRRVSAARRSETSAPIGRTLGERFGDGLITFLF